MTRARWQAQKKEYERYIIMTQRNSSYWVWNCVERVSPVFVENATNGDKLKMFIEIHFKSGTSEKQYFYIKEQHHVTTKSFFGIPIVSRKKFTAQDYFDDEKCMKFVNAKYEEWVRILAKNNKG